MKYPDTYVFPVVFTYEGEQIAVTFPDLPGCTSCADTDNEAFRCAKEAMGGHLWCMENDHDPIPEPTPLKDVQLEENERALLIEVYMPSIRMAQVNKAVNRTVTLPAWLNAAALERKVNFSQVLQNALIEQLHISQR